MGPGGRGVKGCRGAHLWGAWTCPIGPGGLAWNVGEVGPSLSTMSMLTKILQGLAVVVVGMSLESATAVARDLSAFPERALDEAVADSEEDTEDERVRLLRLLSLDGRTTVRLAVAESLADTPASWTPEVEALLAQLAADPAVRVRAAAVDALAGALSALPPLARTEVVAEWAGADDVARRRAVAEVLAWPLAIAGEALVLGALGTDSDDGVRAAARTSLRDRLARVGAHA